MTNSYLTNILKPNKDYIYIDNTIDWFQTIINIIENNNTYNKIRENGQIKALQYYTWDNWANKINNLS
jgi:glycosyltransferase involved in cell wall biosynthesis